MKAFGFFPVWSLFINAFSYTDVLLVIMATHWNQEEIASHVTVMEMETAVILGLEVRLLTFFFKNVF